MNFVTAMAGPRGDRWAHPESFVSTPFHVTFSGKKEYMMEKGEGLHLEFLVLSWNNRLSGCPLYRRKTTWYGWSGSQVRTPAIIK